MGDTGGGRGSGSGGCQRNRNKHTLVVSIVHFQCGYGQKVYKVMNKYDFSFPFMIVVPSNLKVAGSATHGIDAGLRCNLSLSNL